MLFLLTAFTALWFILGLGPNATANIGVTVLGAVYIGVFGSFAALMLKIPVQGVSILLVTVIAAVLYDVGGFFIGRFSLPHPAVRGQPQQDHGGPAGGMLAAVVGVVIVAGFIDVGGFSVGQPSCSVSSALAAPLGDLAELGHQARPRPQGHGQHPARARRPLDRFDALLCRAADRLLRRAGPPPAGL